MCDLLDVVLDAHGGSRRWEESASFEATASLTGLIWSNMGRRGLFDDVLVDGLTRQQRVVIHPFEQLGRRAVWEPDRAALETEASELISERMKPGQAFAGVSDEHGLDDLQVVHLAALIIWSHIAAPFAFTSPGSFAEEIEPCVADNMTWRRLLVTYPESILTPSRRQTCYVGEDGLLCRLEYEVDALGGRSVVDFPSRYRWFEGIAVATRRRAYVRDERGERIPGSTCLAVDVADARFF